MAKQRVQVRDLSGPAPIQPKAEQVNIFHGSLAELPAEDNAALQLAQGLAVLRPSLYQAADIAVDKETKQGEAAALLAERQDNRAALGQAVKAGAIPAGESPWFRKGWNRQKNRLLADKYAADLQVAYQKWGGKDSDDPNKNDVSAMMQGHLQEFLRNQEVDQSDPEFVNVFGTMASQAQDRMYSAHAQYRTDRIEKQVLVNTGSEITSIIDLPYLYGGQDNQARVIQETVADHIKNGASGTVMNKVAVDSITQQAIAKGDTDILSLLDKVDTGNGRLGRTLYAREERLKAENHIAALKNSKLSDEWTQSEHSRKLAGEAIHAEAIKRLQADKDDPLTDLIAAAADTDPEKAGALLSFRTAYLGMRRTGRTAVTDTASVYADIYKGAIDHGALIALASDPSRDWTQDDVRDFTIAIEKYEQANGRGGILRDPLYNDTQSAIQKAIRGSDVFHDNPQRDLAATKANAMFAQYMIQYSTQNPAPSPKDIQNEMFRMEEVLIKRYSLNVKAQSFQFDPLEALKAEQGQAEPTETKKPVGHEPGTLPATK